MLQKRESVDFEPPRLSFRFQDWWSVRLEIENFQQQGAQKPARHEIEWLSCHPAHRIIGLYSKFCACEVEHRQTHVKANQNGRVHDLKRMIRNYIK